MNLQKKQAKVLIDRDVFVRTSDKHGGESSRCSREPRFSEITLFYVRSLCIRPIESIRQSCRTNRLY